MYSKEVKTDRETFRQKGCLKDLYANSQVRENVTRSSAVAMIRTTYDPIQWAEFMNASKLYLLKRDH